MDGIGLTIVAWRHLVNDRSPKSPKNP